MNRVELVKHTIDLAKSRILKPSQLIAEALLVDLSDRKGIKQELEQCDAEVIDDMTSFWAEIVEQVLSENTCGIENNK